MKIFQGSLSDHMKIIHGTAALAGKNALPILESILIERADDQLKMVTCNMEAEIIADLGESKGPDASFCVNASKVSSILGAAIGDIGIDLSGEGESKRAQIKFGKSRFNLNALPGADFPRIRKDPKNPVKISIPSCVLRSLLSAAETSAADKDIRYYLNGVFLTCCHGRLTAVGTNGHMMTVSSAGLDSAAETSSIIPVRTVNRLLALLPHDEKPVRMTIAKGTIRVQFGEVDLTGTLIEGKYPDWNGVFKDTENNQATAVLNKVELLDAIGRIAIIDKGGIRLILKGAGIALVTAGQNDAQSGDAEEEIEALTGGIGQPIDLGISLRYLHSAVAAMASDKVMIRAANAESSVLICDPDGKDQTKTVVMPLRI